MTKIVTADGALINADYYEFEQEKSIIQDVWQVSASYIMPPLVAYRGTVQACEVYLHKLAMLTGAYEWRDGGFIPVKRAFVPVSGGSDG